MTVIDEDFYLEHYGVRGMKWGVRKDNVSGVSNRTNREARKDAQEFARAKMFYGKGAGTRRKLIRETVDAKKKRDPSYAKAFDHHLDRQDMSTHASKARGERSRKDKREKTRQTAGFFARRFTGEMGTTAAFLAVGTAGAAFLKSPRGQAFARQTVAKAKVAMSKTPKATDWLIANGIKL